MDTKQTIQENQYDFPYHHLPSISSGFFTPTRAFPGSFIYMSYIEAVMDKINNLSHNSILDIGCGDGKFLREASIFFPEARLVGNDYSKRAIALSHAFNFNKKVLFTTESAEKIAADEGQFEIVTTIEVLEHIPPSEVSIFCRNFASSLSKNGFGIITVPSDNVPVNKKHYQHFNKETLEEAIHPYLEIKDIFFLNKKSAIEKIIRRIFSNRFFILNHTKICTLLYSYYCRNLLYTSNPKKNSRIMAIVQNSTPRNKEKASIKHDNN